MYPFIDTHTGGSIEGIIKALERILEISDDKTVIIPGHGPVSNKGKLMAYTSMLKTISSLMQAMIAGQATLEQVQAAEPTRDFDEKYGNGFIRNTAFVEMLYKDIMQD
jgi:glyoxylase-like metal-dependent hydrolase (beta-lactamase superfamily II)